MFNILPINQNIHLKCIKQEDMRNENSERTDSKVSSSSSSGKVLHLYVIFSRSDVKRCQFG